MSDIASNALMIAAIIIIAGAMDTLHVRYWRKRLIKNHGWWALHPDETLPMKAWVGAAVFIAIIYLVLHIGTAAGFHI